MNPRKPLTLRIVAALAGLFAVAGVALTGCADDGAATRDGGSVSGSGSGSSTGSASR